jgi:hypothetical protein
MPVLEKRVVTNQFGHKTTGSSAVRFTDYPELAEVWRKKGANIRSNFGQILWEGKRLVCLIESICLFESGDNLASWVMYDQNEYPICSQGISSGRKSAIRRMTDKEFERTIMSVFENQIVAGDKLFNYEQFSNLLPCVETISELLTALKEEGLTIAEVLPNQFVAL